MDTPNLARVVPLLQPEVLHRVLDRCGLEDSGELVALATPEQLGGVLDLDLWRSPQPGQDEQFSADRFGVWLEVLAELDAGVTARTLAGMDASVVTSALTQYVRVLDPGVIAPLNNIDGEELPLEPGDGLSWQVGGYQVVARRPDAWDAIVAALVSLESDYPDYFHRVMRGCRSLSDSAPEIDGLDDLLTTPEQMLFDVTTAREQRREQRGYATPAEARAFLQMARDLRLDRASAPSDNPISVGYFRGANEPSGTTTTTIEAADKIGRLLPADAPPRSDDAVSGAAALVDVLIDEGVLPRPPRALLAGREEPPSRLVRIQTLLQFVHDHAPASFSMRTQELAFLANTIVAGCSIQARPFTALEASDAALAACNLGLENWPPHWSLPSETRDARVDARRVRRRSAPAAASSAAPTATPLSDDFLVSHDLVGVFQVGWNILHARVCMPAARRLVSVLKDLTCSDRDIQSSLTALRVQMAKEWKAGTPWRAREALDVITSLDMPAWAALLCLIDECPVLHAGIAVSRGARVLSFSASAFEFIAANSQIDAAHAFMDSLADTLRG